MPYVGATTCDPNNSEEPIRYELGAVTVKWRLTQVTRTSVLPSYSRVN